MKDILNYSTNGLEMQSERAGWWDKDREREERTEQFTKWSMGHTTDIVVALSKARGGRTGEERRGEEGRGGRRKVGERGGGAIRGDEMVIGPSWLSLKANNHSHNHTTHLEIKMCVWWCPWMCVCVCEAYYLQPVYQLQFLLHHQKTLEWFLCPFNMSLCVSVCMCAHTHANICHWASPLILSYLLLIASVRWSEHLPWERMNHEKLLLRKVRPLKHTQVFILQIKYMRVG